jgi:hypothetical protein
MRGKPFEKGRSGNPNGRKRGTRNRATTLRAILDDAGADVVQKIVDLAKGGDLTACRMILDRLIPPLRAVEVEEPVGATGDKLADLAESIVRESVAGRLSPEKARRLTAALSAVARVRMQEDLESRVEKLERIYENDYPQNGAARVRH